MLEPPGPQREGSVCSARFSAVLKLQVQVRCHVQKCTGRRAAADDGSGGEKLSYELFINSAYECRRKGETNKENYFPETVFLNKQTNKFRKIANLLLCAVTPS